MLASPLAAINSVALAINRFSLEEMLDAVQALVADPNQLRQVFWNLLDNAADVSLRPGTIDIENSVLRRSVA